MDWHESAAAALAALGLKLVNVVVGAGTSFISLRFFNDMSTTDKWFTFFGGWIIAVWGAEPLREYLQQKPNLEVGFVILLGLFGMAVSAEVIKIVRETDWRGILKGIVDFILRRNQGGGQ